MASKTTITADTLHATIRARQAVSAMRTGLRFGAVFLLSFAVVWVGVMVVHFLGNPDGMFPSTRNPSRRELAWKTRQLDRLVREGNAPSVLILGSSRIMQVFPAQVEQLTGGKAFNFGAPGSSPMDMLAHLRFALARGAPIKSVFIGIDDQAMFGNYENSHGTRIAMVRELFTQLPVREQIRIVLRMPAQVKPELTWQALRQAIDPPQLASVPPGSIGIMLRDDGYLIPARQLNARRRRRWDPREDLLRQIEILRNAGDAALLYPAGAKLSDRQVEYLRQLLKLCRKHKIRAMVVLTPVQPDYAELSLSPADKLKVRELSVLIERLCQKRRATYRDLSSAQSFAAMPWEWRNLTHMLAENSRRMVNVAYGKPPEYRLDQLPDDFTLLREPTPVNSVNTP
ncbi:MAG: hypothetical protein H7Z14_20300 [Anaerolineae bacterium]|nr:hypothetical protein [Phycisphaerae bacterium]